VEAKSFVSVQLKYLATCALAALFLAFASGAFTGEYFDKEVEKGIEHISNALMAWHEVNQLGLPNSDVDLKHIIALLKRVHSECAKVPDKTLRKMDAELAKEFRNNLQEGACLYASGMSEYRKAVKKVATPSSRARTDMTNGQQKLVRFQRFYNANIERIIRFLKSKGVDIIG